MINVRGAAAAAALLVFATGALAAPVKKKAAPPKLRMTAEQVLERSVEATGGRAAYAKITSMVTKGTMESAAQGIHGTFTATVKAPNKIRGDQSIPGFAETHQGFDGKTGWSQDPFSGLRTLGGQELATMKQMSQIDAQTNWRALYKKAEMLGTRKVDKRDTLVVRLTPLVGKPATGYYDARTFLLLRMDIVVENPQGSIPMELYFSDYRPVEGVKMPFVTRQRVGGIAEILLTITDVQQNVPVDDALFVKPSSPAPAKTEPASPVPATPAPAGQ